MQSKVLLCMELPPPMHGMTYINKIIYDNLKGEEGYYFYDTNFTLDVNEVGSLSLNKVMKNIGIILGAWRKFFQIKPIVAYSLLSASNFGIIRDFMINLPFIVTNKKLVLHLHGFTYYKIYNISKLYKFLFDIMSKNAILIVLCEKQKYKTMEVMSKKSVVLYNCLREGLQPKDRIQNGTLKICYISNISKDKGVFNLIEAVKRYSGKIELVIAGNFLSNKEEFLELISKSGNIKYLGFADEKMKDDIFQSSDIFCLPSKLEEGSPISIIEAMSHGLPVIASDKGCIKDMIENAGCLLPDNYTSVDILDGMTYIKDNYDKLSENSFNKYQMYFSQRSFIKNFKKILKNKL